MRRFTSDEIKFLKMELDTMELTINDNLMITVPLENFDSKFEKIDQMFNNPTIFFKNDCAEITLSEESIKEFLSTRISKKNIPLNDESVIKIEWVNDSNDDINDDIPSPLPSPITSAPCIPSNYEEINQTFMEIYQTDPEIPLINVTDGKMQINDVGVNITLVQEFLSNYNIKIDQGSLNLFHDILDDIQKSEFHGNWDIKETTIKIYESKKTQDPLEVYETGGYRLDFIGKLEDECISVLNHYLKKFARKINQIQFIGVGCENPKTLTFLLDSDLKDSVTSFIFKDPKNSFLKFLTENIELLKTFAITELTIKELDEKDDGIKFLKAILNVQQNIQYLNLSRGNLSEKVAQVLAIELSQNKKYAVLKLNDNTFSDQDQKIIFESLKTNTYLREIYLNNKYTGGSNIASHESIVSLIDLLKCNFTLRVVELNYAKEIPADYQRELNTLLKNLHLRKKHSVDTHPGLFTSPAKRLRTESHESLDLDSQCTSTSCSSNTSNINPN